MKWYVCYGTLVCADRWYSHRDASTQPALSLQRRTLWMTGKSRKKGAVQSELARVCNVPHKNFFIVVKASVSAVPEFVLNSRSWQHAAFCGNMCVQSASCRS